LFKGRNPSSVAGYNAQLNNIIVNPDSLVDTDSVASYIAHELTHGVDNSRWGGRVTMVPSAELTPAQYITKPEEVNARFTQALYDLAKDAGSGTAKDSTQTVQKINDALAKNQLSREIFDAGTDGQKQYDRMRSRAYQFLQQMEPLVDPGKPVDPSLFDKVRKMVTTFAGFS
jgi:hypothetical protein